MTRLADTLKDLLTLALDDFEKVYAQPDVYRIAMSHWHTPRDPAVTNDRCFVCLAGAVMTQRFEADPDVHYGAHDFGGSAEMQFRALDAIRVGNIGFAAEYFYAEFDPPETVDRFDLDVGEYDVSAHDEWMTYMRGPVMDQCAAMDEHVANWFNEEN